MDTNPETRLIDQVTRGLEDLGLNVILNTRRTPGAPQSEACLRIGVKSRKGKATAKKSGVATTDYVVEVRRTVTPATLGATVTQLRDRTDACDKPTLLIADYLTPPVAQKLREQHQQFVDAAGNVYLEGPGLLIYVTGRKPQKTLVRARTTGLFTPNGLKVLFVLLCDPVLASASQRTIAAAAGVALGTVPAALGGLQSAGHLLVADGIRRLNFSKKLLDEWALAYAGVLRPKTLIAMYRTPHFDTWKDWSIDPAQVQWGGEPAANLLVRHLRPAVLTLYADKLPPRLVVKERLTPVAAAYEQPYLEVRKPIWGRAFMDSAAVRTASPVLVYADLLATGDGRCIETAGMVYEKFIARLHPPL